MNKNNYIVILAGGSGTRLWPISRAHLPKQFHKFGGDDRSLIQVTYDRISKLVPKENIYVSLVENIYKTTRQQLPKIAEKNYIIEPESKNTAPAFALIAAKLYKTNPNAIIATVPSDHTIEDIDTFQKILKEELVFIDKNPEYIITIGIEPTEPQTGFGYIKKGRKLIDKPIYEIEKFVEKPDLKTAIKYLASGDYLWNANYFVWQAGSMLKKFKKFEPKMFEKIQKIQASLGTANEKANINKIYAEFEKKPIEPTIIEKTKEIFVYPASFGWSDVGSWDSLYELLSKDTGSTNITRGHHVGVDDKNCLVYAQDKLLATVGLEDIIIVDTPDVTLVCNKKKSQQIKDLMELLKQKGKYKYL